MNKDPIYIRLIDNNNRNLCQKEIADNNVILDIDSDSGEVVGIRILNYKALEVSGKAPLKVLMKTKGEEYEPIQGERGTGAEY